MTKPKESKYVGHNPHYWYEQAGRIGDVFEDVMRTHPPNEENKQGWKLLSRTVRSCLLHVAAAIIVDEVRNRKREGEGELGNGDVW